MSSMSMTSRRQIWSNQHPLRKQRSLIDNNNVCGYLNNNNNSTIINGNLLNSQRTTSFSVLQKQFSVDRIYNSRYNNNNNNNSANNSSANGRSLTRQDHRYDRNNNGNNNHNNINRLTNAFNRNRTNSGGQSSTLSVKDSNELSVFLTSKKKTVQIGYGDKKERNIGSDRLSRKSSKGGGEDKLNLNIFLGQSITETDNDDGSCSDDVDSSTESPKEINQSKQRPKTAEKPPPVPSSTITKPTIRKPLSAASRRAQFQSNRNNSINLSTTSIISAAPSLTISSRPPLVRAMSAPIRTLDENSKYILANKRKSRRRKILGRQSSICDNTSSPTNNNNLIENNNNNNNELIVDNENNENLNDKNRNGKQNNKSFNKTRPELGCDVVTLVSLISSEGSDSEKEEILPTKNIVVASPVKRAPTLRKTGKSVSFQEHDIPNFTTATKEFPHMLRRGSVAPLAARIRANRPPTAPPVSIFIADFENSHTKMSEKIKSSSKEDLSTITTQTLTHQSDSKNCTDDDNSGDKQFPEYVRTIKERECWKLFQKMSNKGVSVSYDTILRGMLTPTELRHLQKQREHEEAIKAKQLKQAEEALLNEQLKK